MATTTRAVLRQRLSEAIGDYRSQTTTAEGTTTTLKDSTLANLPGGGDINHFEEWYVLVTSGANEGTFRRISRYNVQTTTLVVESAFGSAVDTTVTYELHRYDPSHKHNAINRAIEELYPSLHARVRDETLVIDDLLSNSDFETFSTTFTGWTEVGSPTTSAETSLVMHGSQSAKVVADAGAAGQLTQTPTVNVNQVTNRSATFKCWVYTTAADTARVRLDWNGSDIDSSDYHTGNDQWELMSVTATVPSDATQIKAVCEVAAGGTAYFDAAWLLAGPVYKYTVPTTIIGGPYYVSQQFSETDPDGPYYQLPKNATPTSGRRLRIEGIGLLSRPTTDSATVELGEPRISTVVAYAARWFYRMLAGDSALEQNARWTAAVEMWSAEASRMSTSPGLRMPKPGGQMGRQVWHLEEDSDGRYIIFDRSRDTSMGDWVAQRASSWWG